MKNKLAIVGSGPQTRSQAPFNDKSWDIWVFNEAPMAEWCKRYTASFQLHNPDIYTGHNAKQADYWQWLQEPHGKPVYMQELDTRVPDCVAYPLKDVLKLAGFQMLGMSVCFAMALGILQGYEHIEVWGVELSSTEYAFGGDSWRFWVGFAKGKLGAEHVVLHSGINLFESLLYGYDGSVSIGKDYFDKRTRYLNNTWESSNKHAINVKKYLLKCIEKQEFMKAKEAIQDFQEKLYYTGELAGALTECEKYREHGDDPSDKNAFEMSAAEGYRDNQDAQVKMHKYSGVVEYIWNVWTQQKNDKAAKHLLDMVNEMGKAAEMAGAYNGRYTENLGYMRHYDEIMQANGVQLPKLEALQPEMVR